MQTTNSPLVHYQQSAQNFKGQTAAKKGMNVQSPVFVPNSSCSSSTGGEVSIGSASNGNLLTSSLELAASGGTPWPILAATAAANTEVETPPKQSSGKKPFSKAKKDELE